MDTYTVHLAMAALAGASLAAVSAYYVHLKTLTQALDFAKSMERDNNNSEGAESAQNLKKKKKRRSRERRNEIDDGYYRRGSGSVPEATVIKGGISEEKKGDGYVSRIHALPEGW